MFMDHAETTFCPIPWNHLSMLPDGSARICCDMDSHGWGLLNANARDTPFDELRNRPELKQLRKNILEGRRSPVCGKCWTVEDSGSKSRRQILCGAKPELKSKALELTDPSGGIRPTDFPLEHLDLRFGNKCNLACRSCDPSASSLWMAKWLEHEDEISDFKYFDRKVKLDASFMKWSDDDLFFKEFEKNLGNINHLYFTGGEPFINSHHWQLLKRLIDAGRGGYISLEYNSNVVSLPADALELWRQFRQVFIGASIDGIGHYAECLRPPGKWPQIEKNLRALDQAPAPIEIGLSTTVSALNIHHIPELIRWILNGNFKRIHPEFWVNLLFQPFDMSVQVLPLEFKKKVEQEYERLWLQVRGSHPDMAERLKAHFSGMLKHMNASDQSHRLPRLLARLQKQDLMFGQSFAQEWSALIQEPAFTRPSENNLSETDPTGGGRY